MLLNCGYFVLSHPTPLHLQEIVAMHSIKLAMGVCGWKDAHKRNKGLIEAFWKTLFNFMLLNCGYFVLSHPTPLRLQEIVAMHSI